MLIDIRRFFNICQLIRVPKIKQGNCLSCKNKNCNTYRLVLYQKNRFYSIKEVESVNQSINDLLGSLQQRNLISLKKYRKEFPTLSSTMAPIQFLINLASVSVALFLIYWGKMGNLRQLIQFTFENRKLSTSQAQADHLADIAYYYAIYVICLSSLVTSVRFLRGQFNQAVKSDANFVTSLNKIIVNSSQHFLIFMSIYVYLLQQKGAGLKIDHILLMPFLFLVGRLGSFIEHILTQIASNKFVFSFFGLTLTLVTHIVMLGQIFGQSTLSWF